MSARHTRYPLAPGHVEILLYHYVSSAPWPRPEAPFYVEAVSSLEADGMLEYRPTGWHTTAKGEAWIKAICAMPFPTVAWKVEYPNADATMEARKQ